MTEPTDTPLKRRRTMSAPIMAAHRSLPGAARHIRRPDDPAVHRAVYDRARMLRKNGLTWRQVQKRAQCAKQSLDAWAKKYGWEVLS